MKEITEKELEALCFWARVGVETHMDGQYRERILAVLCHHYSEPINFGERYAKAKISLKVREYCNNMISNAQKMSWQILTREKLDPLEELFSDFPKTTIEIHNSSL